MNFYEQSSTGVRLKSFLDLLDRWFNRLLREGLPLVGEQNPYLFDLFGNATLSCSRKREGVRKIMYTLTQK